MTLQQLRKMDFPETQTLVYVNGCTDGTQAMLGREYPKICMVLSEKNDGASKARNALVRLCRTDYVVGLDSDSWPMEDDIGKVIPDAFERWPEAAILAGCIFDANYPSGPVDMGQVEFEVRNFVACGFAIHRTRFLEAGGFQSCFLYGNEESELSLRIHARGWKTVYIPTFRVYHAKSPTSRPKLFNQREGFCNALSSVILNEPIGLCGLHLLGLTIKALIFYSRKRQFAAPLLAWWDFLRRLPRLLRDRRPVSHAIWMGWRRTRACPPQDISYKG